MPSHDAKPLSLDSNRRLGSLVVPFLPFLSLFGLPFIKTQQQEKVILIVRVLLGNREEPRMLGGALKGLLAGHPLI